MIPKARSIQIVAWEKIGDCRKAKISCKKERSAKIKILVPLHVATPPLIG
jgi:hypothetical protein